MKVLVGAFNQEKALVGAFSVIVKTDCGTDGALHSSSQTINNADNMDTRYFNFYPERDLDMDSGGAVSREDSDLFHDF